MLTGACNPMVRPILASAGKEAMIERLDFYLDKTKLTVTDGAPDKCVYVQKEWTGVSDAGGHLYLAIDMKRAKGLTISHVYTL